MLIRTLAFTHKTGHKRDRRKLYEDELHNLYPTHSFPNITPRTISWAEKNKISMKCINFYREHSRERIIFE